MVADSAFEPKNFVSTSVGMYKNSNSHKLETFLGGNEIFQDNIYQAAYGRRSLGNPVLGDRSNVNYLNAGIIQKFQAAHLNPKRIIISAAGIESHDEFVDLVNEKLSTNILNDSSSQREAAKYVGGEVRNLTEANSIHIALAFEGANYRSSLPLLIASEVLGNGRRMGRLQQNVLNKHVFVDGAQAINVNYSDTGLFGIKLSGSAAHARDILYAAAQELAALREVSGADVELAKQALKGRLNRTMVSTSRRLEERTKALYYIGQTNENFSEIDSVSAGQVQEAVSNALRTPLTLVTRGGEVNTLPSYDSISRLFN